jgi:hypothetical protein
MDYYDLHLISRNEKCNNFKHTTNVNSIKYMNKKVYDYFETIPFLLVSLQNNFYNKIHLWSILLLLMIYSNRASAQDPTLPPTNLGVVNVFDGMGGKPGFVYQGFVQIFQTNKVINGQGQDIHSDLKVNSIVQINQIIYQTPIKVFGGILGFTVIIPVVQINASNSGGSSPTVNPNILGDITQGTAVQWSGKKLFSKPFSHRLDVNFNLPIGSYNEKYNINPSAQAYTFSTNHAFTLMLNDRISVSAKNQFNYNSHIVGQKAKAGAFYNGNYSIDYAIIPNLRVEAVSYFLAQLNEDSFDGDSNYYQQQMGISDTKERVLGYGAGLAYFTKGGALIELKTFFETASKNRVEGYRPTLRIAIPLN